MSGWLMDCAASPKPHHANASSPPLRLGGKNTCVNIHGGEEEGRTWKEEMRSSNMWSKMIPRRETRSKRKASGEAAPLALPAKTTKEEDTAPSTSTSSDDGAKCQNI
ncbi:hypothetical protein Taro_042840 [Colocasia esculenta]|uniref:Uncharacterized protein n=1 Tax=Colocasia esculenta TaxID=4460 RepID=A0A843WEW7_COLES|nr:hypothetical protein [Colocasia esculenta]